MPKKFYIIPLAILGIALVSSYFALLREKETLSRFSSEASATITETDVRRTADVETGKEQSVDVIIIFEYEIDGHRFERTVRKSKLDSSRFVPWGNAKVCYDATDLTSFEKAELIPASDKCG